MHNSAVSRSLTELESELYERWSYFWDMSPEDQALINSKRYLDVEETMALFTKYVRQRRRLCYRPCLLPSPLSHNRVTTVSRSLGR